MIIYHISEVKVKNVKSIRKKMDMESGTFSGRSGEMIIL
jgi:hypothetical protein